ncbi:MAG TPA: acetyl-CoA carboxylase biotin carboxyl carrier protein [Bacteroidia bacterium]|nr:acetyl-CoA carboxylase biotin carboxyl carrier protein [Bacteroidia bacterium]HNT79546.1 acetyl-CoA carboxylase biotin carboxyl carrier protein [Bacteroidia bacterium]
MNKKEIEELIKFVSKSGVSEVSLEQKDFKITIKNKVKEPREQIIHAPAMMPMMHAPAVAAAPVPAPAPAASAASKAEVPKSEDAGKYITVKSPMIGTFYRASSPDKPNFINVGDEVKPGKVLCIIEAMKLFNEIESEVAGKIVKVLIDNASPVEYDQPLFLVDPS